jgi:hypothetical protein
MLSFTTTILQFANSGAQKGWTYIKIPAALAIQLKPGNKKTFRVKGFLDNYPFAGISLLPIGEGNFMMPLNATIRKNIRKQKGAKLQAHIEVDENPVPPPPGFMDCLADEPKAMKQFNALTKSHQHYFIKWIDSAKTEPTTTKRIAQAVDALANALDFGMMIRMQQKKRKDEGV